MRSICAFASLALAFTLAAPGAQAQTTPEQLARRRHYGTVPSPTRHLGEIRPRQDRLGTLRGPQGSLVQPSPIPYVGGGFVMQATRKPPEPAPAEGPQSQLQPSPSRPPEADNAPIERPNAIPRRIMACWSPPASSIPMEVTVRLSFSKAGEVVGQPRVTYVKAGSDDNLRKAISASILAAIQSCVPLRFTPALGHAIAGRVFAIRFIAPPARKPAGSI